MDDDNLNQLNIKADFGCHFRPKELKLYIVHKKNWTAGYNSYVPSSSGCDGLLHLTLQQGLAVLLALGLLALHVSQQEALLL